MAKFIPGSIAGQISGSIGSTTFSRNRYGAYTRVRSLPVQPDTIYQQDARGILSTASQGWAGLSDAQRASWKSWAQQNPITDRLGTSQILSGNAAYVKINARRAACGDAALTTPPLAAAPPGLLSIVLDGDIGAGDMDVTFTATPLAAGLKLYLQGALLLGNGKTYYKNHLRFLGLSAAAQASPFDVQTLFADRLGTLVVGMRAVVLASVYDSATGLISQPLSSAVVLTTT